MYDAGNTYKKQNRGRKTPGVAKQTKTPMKKTLMRKHLNTNLVKFLLLPNKSVLKNK
jgi:hypothetical protein